MTYWFVFIGGSVLLRKDASGYSIPLGDEAPTEVKAWSHVLHLPELDGTECRAYSVDSPAYDGDEYVAVGLRESYEKLPLKFYNAAGKAAELLYWDKSTRFCGVCGAPTEFKTFISKTCTHCGKEYWPQVSPAIIVRIRRRDEAGKESLLLVHAKNFRKNFYGLVAGFVETGETLEECVRREVKEETNLTIKNIKYFASQPWPYPSGIMVGFTADYEAGLVDLQEEELSRGGWFSIDNLPTLPDKLSIARRLIDDWIDGNGGVPAGK